MPRPNSPLPDTRDGFKFRSGRLALDLPATLAARLKAEPRDLLAAPRDLGRWFVAAGLAPRDPHPTEADLATARKLREALYRLVRTRVHEEPFAAGDLALVNRWAAEPPPAPQLGAHGLTWTGGGVGALLAAVARDGVELLGGPLAGRVRACEGEGCSLYFLDTSRSGRRRWCSMAACGNKEKVGAFRQRWRGGQEA